MMSHMIVENAALAQTMGVESNKEYTERIELKSMRPIFYVKQRMKKADTTRRAQEKHERQNCQSSHKTRSVSTLER